ncbi:16900_t:CDS:2 [Funneliformis geosporum]|uniref:mRNA 3'-end-processing protein n=1 Tax=Funneliformis geosporum TaxID=1117311 RepID=A0A9W4SR04_9GLOM|nr:16900_t:CDS:2 [Funneliformis geosporum]CAI2177316.1 6779_t:CDS:2 [Funneliformis geosporum]
MVASENEKFFYNDGSKYTFDFEKFIKNELGLGKKTDIARRPKVICQDYLKGACTRDTTCKYQHKIRKIIVCKHWLRGLCMKGDERCDYLHEYNLSRMPKCVYYTLHGVCNSPNCIYSHNDIDCEKCSWYDRGFCKNGPTCFRKHVKQIACQLYLAGFCPRGSNCPNGHPKAASIRGHHDLFLPNKEKYRMMNCVKDNMSKVFRAQNRTSYLRKDIFCFNCGEKGHFARNCIS